MSHLHPSATEIAAAVALASRAPSVHNTQPWQWRVTAHSLDLFADRSRRLQASDPHGRMLMLSCGATLHHLATSMASMGWRAQIRRLPEPRRPSLLASITFTPRDPGAEALELVDAIKARRTDRRPMSTWEVPAEQLQRLIELAAEHGSIAQLLVPGQADEWLAAAEPMPENLKHEVLSESSQWTHRDAARRDGVPGANLPGGVELRGGRRVGGEDAADDAEPNASVASLLLSTSSDDTLACLRAGEALSAVLLEATRRGLATAIDSEPLEQDSARDRVEHEFLHGTRTPQVIVRVGWPSSADPLPETPRREVPQILRRHVPASRPDADQPTEPPSAHAEDRAS